MIQRLSRLSAITGTASQPDGAEKNSEIPTSIAESVTNVCLFHDSLNTFQSRMLTTNKFIYGPLAAEMKLPAKKRPTRFANKSHLLHFERQLWKEDWFEYQKLTNVQNAVTGSEE